MLNLLSRRPDRQNVAFAGILLLALVSRIATLVFVSHPEIQSGEFQLQEDEWQYHYIALSVAESGDYNLVPPNRTAARVGVGGQNNLLDGTILEAVQKLPDA